MPGVFTLKKKPGALATSVALHKANPRLKEIYHQYYTTKGRDFIDLIFFVSEHGLEKVEDAINLLNDNEAFAKEVVVIWAKTFTKTPFI